MGVHLFQTVGFFPFHNDSNTNIAQHPHSTKTAAHKEIEDSCGQDPMTME
jgi:hypothetical protein